MAEDYYANETTRAYTLSEGRTILGVGTKEEMEALQKKIGKGSIQQGAVTKFPTAAETLAREGYKEKTATERLTGQQPRPSNLNRIIRGAMRGTRGTD